MLGCGLDHSLSTTDIYSCEGLNVLSSLHSYVETPIVSVFGDEASQEVIKIYEAVRVGT